MKTSSSQIVLMFQYGIEAWTNLEDSTLRVLLEYADLTSYWWTDDPRTRNITYGHHIYNDGYRYRGRPIGHWADQDSQILSFGGVLQKENGIGWGTTIRTGKLNEDGAGISSSVSASMFQPIISPSMFSILGNIKLTGCQ